MSIQKIVFNTQIQASSFFGDGSNLTGITSTLYYGTANHFLITDNNGDITNTQYLSPNNGGLGSDVSGFNGVVKGDGSGNFFSNSDIDNNANIDISKLNAYPYENTKVLIGDGSWNMIVNANVDASCNLDRNKLAPDTRK